jgi:hypothetical protein
MRGYIVSLRQRITIPNSSADSFRSIAPLTSYSNYPILAVQMVRLAPTDNLVGYLEDYAPKTLNATVNQSANASTSSNTGTSVQQMQGSSFSVTNSYDVSGSIGFFGEDPTGSVSAGFSHSETSTSEQSTTAGQSAERRDQAGTASSTSIKEWGAYAFLDAAKQSPSWVWGQEYPWNIIRFRNMIAKSQNGVELPGYVQSLLCDQTTRLRFLYWL